MIDTLYYLINGIGAIIGTLVGFMKQETLQLQFTKAHIVIITKRHFGIAFVFCVVGSIILSLCKDKKSENALAAKEAKHRSEDSARDAAKFKQIAELEAQHTKEVADVILRAKESNRQDLTENTHNIISAMNTPPPPRWP